MHDLLRKQTIGLILCTFLLMAGLDAHSQKELYRQDHDNMDYYFGLTLNYNSSYLKTTKSAKFLASDSIMVTEPGSSGGVALGLMGTLRLDDHFQFRVNPQLIIGGSKYISYNLNPTKTMPGEASFQNKGYGSDAVRLLVSHGFNNLNLKRIFLHVFCTNTRAIKAYLKCGFQIEGVLKKAAFIAGEYIDVNSMAIINE